VEKPFGIEGKRQEDVIQEERATKKDDLDAVVAIALSHSKVNNKNNLIMSLLEHIGTQRESRGIDSMYAPCLRELAELQNPRFAKVALKARAILVESMLPSYEDRRSEMERVLLGSVQDHVDSDTDSELSSTSTDSGLILGSGTSSSPTAAHPPSSFSASSASSQVSHLPEFTKLRQVLF